MRRSRDWVGGMVLRAPESVRALRNVPLVGGLIHSVSQLVLDPEERIWVQVEAGPAAGLWLELNPRTGQAYARGTAEPAVQQALSERLRAGDVFYDLGANLGFFTLLAARSVGPTGKVFAFEPDFENGRRLERNVVRNHFANVSLVEAGVWSSTGERHFSSANPGSLDRGIGCFSMGDGPSEGPAIPCVSLDDFVNSAAAPAGIKCDVEGAEVEVLRGARDMLIRHRPWILCETQSPENSRAVRQLLGGLGYAVESLDEIHLFAAP